MALLRRGTSLWEGLRLPGRSCWPCVRRTRGVGFHLGRRCPGPAVPETRLAGRYDAVVPGQGDECGGFYRCTHSRAHMRGLRLLVRGAPGSWITKDVTARKVGTRDLAGKVGRCAAAPPPRGVPRIRLGFSGFRMVNAYARGETALHRCGQPGSPLRSSRSSSTKAKGLAESLF